ncbi:hypothetical protein LOC71_22290 [Rhodopirellula sp. JC740]|uniref:Major tail protein n=1 Tax=Rhodopirellula halodulae TaxID=2894198 RepID=A0ABS8NN70_9BACT|nr:hypothetical protein [Rhodopirellula sp. JC740]MCC9645016.1 hypothetical protein [Rhodopirellula sp. JC740]
MASDLNNNLPNGLYQGGSLGIFNGIRIKEQRGRSGVETTSGTGTAQRTWLVSNTENPQAAKAALIDGPVLINEFDGKFIESLEWDTGLSSDSWEFTAHYSAAVPNLGSYTVSIDTTGGTILQTTSYEQTRFAIAGKQAPDFKKAIDVQDGAPQGVQRIIPTLKINVRAKIPTEFIYSPMRYAKLIARLTGTTNVAPMFDDEFAPGELLFAGASGDVVAEDPQLSFTFLASENATDLSIGGISGITKPGHAYAWALFDTDKDSTTGLLVSKPRAIYVDKIYGGADHDLLKIGHAPTVSA